MKFFVAAYEHVDPEENPAELGEIVMPDFSPGANGFISAETGKKSPGAMIMSVDRDPDELFETLDAHYPGIPTELLKEWFTETVATAYKLGESDVVYSARATEKSASVFDPISQISHDVWVDVDPTDYLT